jgi:hypothetical protein
MVTSWGITIYVKELASSEPTLILPTIDVKNAFMTVGLVQTILNVWVVAVQ